MGGIGAKSVILQGWLLVGSGDPQIEGRSRAVPPLGWPALPSIKMFLCGRRLLPFTLLKTHKSLAPLGGAISGQQREPADIGKTARLFGYRLESNTGKTPGM